MSSHRTVSALLTDLYQLTMGYAYWQNQTHEDQVVFNLFFRKNPFQGGFTIAAGLTEVVSFLQDFHFEASDLNYLAELRGNDGQPLFEREYLSYLGQLEFQCDVDAIPEGSLVFPHEPLIRVTGPMIQCQLIETALLNLVNFPTLIATKAARVCIAAQSEPVLEFGLRRAQGTDGALSASRAAYIGGCAATSNVLAGELFDIPIKGTHAHSWVMSFDDEITAFRAYAKAMPNNCTFLVDTYDTIQGVKNALIVANELRETGHKWSGIRLDSGDLNHLSICAREMMDAAGFQDASIVASNDLDEYIITNLKRDGAKINVWGVGTNLVTAYDQPALGGVYKLTAALNREHGRWDYKVKLSEQPSKTSNPGIQQVRRFLGKEGYAMDLIYDLEIGLPDECAKGHELSHAATMLVTEAGWKSEDLLIPVFRNGSVVATKESIHETRARARHQLNLLPEASRKLTHPEQYPVGLEEGLHQHKHRLIHKIRANTK